MAAAERFRAGGLRARSALPCRFAPGAISGRYGTLPRELAGLFIALRAAREQGLDDATLACPHVLIPPL